MKLSERIAADGITLTAVRRGTPSYARDSRHDGTQWWHATLRMPDAPVFSFAYGMGPAWEGAPPTAGIVMDCLICDATGYDNSKDYAGWASEYGLDGWRYKADYRLIGARTAKLRGFLGAKYEAYLWDTENDV